MVKTGGSHITKAIEINEVYLSFQNAIEVISPIKENADKNSRESTKEKISEKSSTLPLNSLIDFNIKSATVNYKPEREVNLSSESSLPTPKPTFKLTTKIFNAQTAISKTLVENKKFTHKFKVNTFPHKFIRDKFNRTTIEVTKGLESNGTNQDHVQVGAHVPGVKIVIANETDDTTAAEEGAEFGNITIPVEELETTEDPVEKQINEAINSMPKLPELVLSDKTHIKFHKNSEEMLIDEKITLIARQLAEKSLRKQYEEQLRRHQSSQTLQPSHTSMDNHNRSLKTENSKISVTPPTPGSDFKKSEVKIHPCHHQKNFSLSKSPLLQNESIFNNTVTSSSKPEELYEKMTNLPQIMKADKSDNQIKEINAILKIKKEIVSGINNYILSTPILTNFKKPPKENTKLLPNTEKSISISSSN